jgi:uncharacterized protein (DUF2267 family)
MDELIGLVAEKAGISESQARTAVETVMGYMKDKLPEPLAGQVESVLQGGDVSGGLGGLAKGAGALFDK